MNKYFKIFISLTALLLVACESNPTYEGKSGKKEIALESGKYDDSPANVFINLAIVYLRKNQIETALQYAERAVDKDSSNPNGHNILALIHQRLGQYKKSEVGFRRALSISPNNPYINNTYGGLLCELDMFDKSLIHFNKTIDHPLYSEKWIPQTNIGICALRVGKLETAQDYLRKALQNNGKFPIALYNMIKLSVLQENYLSARAYLQRYLEVGTHNPQTLWWGIKTEQKLGDRDRLESFKLLLRVKYPDSEEAKLLEAEQEK